MANADQIHGRAVLVDNLMTLADADAANVRWGGDLAVEIDFDVTEFEFLMVIYEWLRAYRGEAVSHD